jgi:TRAP-type transport system periplasmic protein
MREDEMRLARRQFIAQAAGTVAAAAAVGLVLTQVSARAEDKIYTMKISAPTINDVPDTYARNFAAALERDSGGRIKPEVYPASQLGSIPRQIEGTQFGAIQCAVIPPEFFVGVDERFEVMAAPGLAESMAHSQRIAADPAVVNLMLGLGAAKGLHGAALMFAEPSDVIAKEAIRHLADFRGKKMRIFASQFQGEAWSRLGVTPVAMSLGDVLPALQQGAIDGAVAGVGPFTHLHFNDAAKYITMINQPAIFVVAEVSQKWYDSLPRDLQAIIDRDGEAEAQAIRPIALEIRKKAEATWVAQGGELIDLPAAEQASLQKTLASVGEDVSKAKPALHEAYQIVADAAARTRQPPGQ